jgi:hypothetical protein
MHTAEDNEVTQLDAKAYGAEAYWTRRRVAAALGAILLLGLLYRIQGIQRESIWWDEYTSVIHLNPLEAWQASPDYPRWVQAVHYEPSPDLLTFWMRNRSMDPATMPLYYTFEYLWHTYLDESMVSLRLLSIFIGMLILPVMYLLGRDMFGPAAGLIAALCLAMSPIHRQFAQEIRMYGLMTLLAALSVYSFVQIVRAEGRRWWALHAAANLLLLWTHPFAVLIPFVEGSFWLLCFPRQFRRVLAWAGMHLLLVIPSVIYIATIQFWAPDMTASWMRIPTPREFLGDLLADDCIGLTYQLRAEPDFWQRIVSLDTAWAVVRARMTIGRCMVAGFVSAGLWLLALSLWRARRQVRTQDGPSWRWVLFAAIWWLGPPLVLYAASHVWRPCIMPRYTLPSSLGMYLLIGGAIAWLPRRWLRVSALGVLVTAYAFQASLILPGPQHTDWGSAARFVRERARSDDFLLVHNELWKRVFLYNMGPVPNVVGYGTSFGGLADITSFLSNWQKPSVAAPGETCRAWVIMQTDYFESAPIPAFEDELRRRGLRFQCEEFGGIQRVLVYHGFQQEPGIEPFTMSREALPDRVLDDYTALALEFWRRNEFEAAVRVCQRALELDPAYAQAYSYLGMAYKELGEDEAAMVAFQRAVDLRPGDYPWNWVNIGMLLLETGRYDESIRALEQALGLLPNDSWAHTCLGKAYLKRGETEKAAALFKKAIEFDPQDQRPVVELNQLTNPAPAPGTS